MAQLRQLLSVTLVTACAPMVPVHLGPTPAESTIIVSILQQWAAPPFDTVFVADTLLSPSDEAYPATDGGVTAGSVVDDDQGDRAFAEAWHDFQRPRQHRRHIDLRSLQAEVTRPLRPGAQAPTAHQQSEPWVLLEFSPIGFSRDSTVAVVNAVYYCGLLCGGSDTYIFRYVGAGTWRVARKYQGWRS